MENSMINTNKMLSILSISMLIDEEKKKIEEAENNGNVELWVFHNSQLTFYKTLLEETDNDLILYY